ncbi:hypothetical protein O1611_g2653 [Lasiodiplodia mahajangana]|uniref:Uncharacterized protein n=1 Tax=Lasiodiplodia mahajangana TaxID=1108764 RepID=A0ACC2JTW3_9PEZI|nr:hypothetical protein O1611_g2653 [Lasiodiplodia mahajangana]
MAKMNHNNQDGLKWQRGFLDVAPCWTREPALPAIENVCREQLKILPEHPCHITFYAAGAFNKLYRVDYDNQSVIMRVTLPVHPHYKTHGEVATLDWLRHNTTIPVPKVIAFDDSNQNEIGFEWIMMEFMPGTPLHRRWRTMAMEKKVDITQRIAEFQAEIFRDGDLARAFKNIGTLYMGNRIKFGEMPMIRVVPDQLVSYEFFRDKRINFDVPRGPFRSSSGWLESHLKIIILEQTAIFEESEDDDDKEEAGEVIAVAKRLLSLLLQVFPDVAEDSLEPAFLFHDDLNLHNILVGKDSNITAIVDWECVSTVPIWITTWMPKFLRGESRTEQPKRDDYRDETPEESVALARSDNPDKLDNEGKDQLYWDHMMEYETTRLREVYQTRLRQLWPNWPIQESYLKLDFYMAVLQCSSGSLADLVNSWIDKIESGNTIRWNEAWAEWQSARSAAEDRISYRERPAEVGGPAIQPPSVATAVPNAAPAPGLDTTHEGGHGQVHYSERHPRRDRGCHIDLGGGEAGGPGPFMLKNWQIGPENSKRAADALKMIYHSEKGGVTKTMTAHRDIPWISANVSYGLFLSDHSILDIQETELVVLAAIMSQNLYKPTYWHLRACLRVGIEPVEVDAIHRVIERVAAYGGKTLSVQRVFDVTDA